MPKTPTLPPQAPSLFQAVLRLHGIVKALQLAKQMVRPLACWLALLLLATLSPLAQAATCISKASGSWTSASTWTCNAQPGSADTVELASGYTVTATSNAVTIAGFTIDSGVSFTGAGTINVSGNITLNGTFTGGSSAILVSTGSGAVISGTGTFASSSRFYVGGSSATLSAGSTLFFTGSASMRTGRNSSGTQASSVLTINGTINGNSQTGTTSTSLLRLYANNTIVGSTGSIVGTTADISFRASTATLTNNGTVSIKTISSTGKWINAANSALTVTSSMATTITLTASANANTVTWVSPATAKTPVASTYYNLAGSGVVCPTSFTILGTTPCAPTPYVASYPSTCVSATGIGSVAWSSPGNAISVNSSVASAGLYGNTSNYLMCSGFNLAVPSGSTINGITVYLTRSTSNGNSPDRDAYVYLIKGGNLSTTMNGATQTNWTTASQTEGHGGVGSLWGTSWTYSDLNSSNFGVAIAAKNTSSWNCWSDSGSNCYAYIDAVQVRVDYTPPPSLHHLRIEHKSTGSTCDPSPVTVRACADAACSRYYTGSDVSNIVLTASGTGNTWSPSATVSTSAAAGGYNTAITLSQTGTVNVTLGVSGTSSPAASASYDCVNTTTGGSDCVIGFSSQYFTYSVPDHVSGTSQSIVVTSCTSSFANSTKSVNFWSTYTDPSSGTLQGKVVAGSGNACAGSSLGTSSSGATALNLVFGAGTAPQATMSLCYPDVGKVAINSQYTSGGTTITGTDTFIARPDHFTLSTIKRTSNSLANPAAADATGAAFVSAGNSTISTATFTATVTAKNASNVATPNFGRESTPQGVLMVVNSPVISPSNGATGMLTCKASTSACILPGGSSNFSSGATTVTDLAWNEVGVMQILPTMAGGSYMGTGEIGTPTASGNIGRFFAHHYIVAPDANSPIGNRADLCAAGLALSNNTSPCDTFTYMGESMSLNFDILAQSADGNILNNYNSASTAADNYARFNLSSLSNSASSNTLGVGMFDSNTSTALSSRTSVGTTASGTFVAGAATISVTSSLARGSAPDGPFDSLTVGVAPVDADGAGTDSTTFDMSVTGSTTTMDHITLGSTIMRFGRLWLGSSFGQSSRTRLVPMQMQFWTGSSFVTNTLDNLSSIPKSSIGLCNLSSSAFGSSFGLGNFASGPYTFSAGVGSMSVSAPAATGSATLLVDLGTTTTANVACTPSSGPGAGASLSHLRNRWYGSTYDRDPTASVTFGVSSGRTGHIYIRESY